jgi:DnaJ-class molecular chaperone
VDRVVEEPPASPGADGAQTGENVCPRCAGTGTVDGDACDACGGRGLIDEPVGDA